MKKTSPLPTARPIQPKMLYYGTPVVLLTRIGECPLQIEARAQHIRIPEHAPFFAIIETKAILVHAHEEIMLNDRHIDPDRWSPLIYNFRHDFGLGKELGRNFRAEN